MSAKARAQRRTAAWKHGERSASAMAQAIPACKRNICPMSDPEAKGNCQLKQQVEASGGAMERCLVRLAVDPELKAKYVEAIRSGDLEGLSEFMGTMLAGMGGLAAQELNELIGEGFATEFQMFGPDGHQITGVKTNPRAEPFLKLAEMVGATAAQQAVTPKSSGERKRDEGLGSFLQIAQRRNELARASGRNALPAGAEPRPETP